jgi:hypothetical protein
MHKHQMTTAFKIMSKRAKASHTCMVYVESCLHALAMDCNRAVEITQTQFGHAYIRTTLEMSILSARCKVHENHVNVNENTMH